MTGNDSALIESFLKAVASNEQRLASVYIGKLEELDLFAYRHVVCISHPEWTRHEAEELQAYLRQHDFDVSLPRNSYHHYAHRLGLDSRDDQQACITVFGPNALAQLPELNLPEQVQKLRGAIREYRNQQRSLPA